MNDNIEYLTPDFVFYIHLVAIDEEFCEYDGHAKYSAEMRGVKDANLFNSAINEPKATFGGQDLYQDILYKAACYLRSISMNHPFFDGNKRTALLSTVIFLEMNGYVVTCSNDELYNFVKEVVENRYTVEKIREILEKNSRISKFSKFKEKLKIINKILKIGK